jgi:DNA-binding MarR family transcriptional regulator
MKHDRIRHQFRPVDPPPARWAGPAGAGFACRALEGRQCSRTHSDAVSCSAGRNNAGTKLKDVTSHLGVSQPTVSDSVLALERKGLVAKRISPADSRSVEIDITASGRSAVMETAAAASAVEQSLAALPAPAQEDLLRHIIALIRSLQMSGAISEQRLCVTCRHFRPNVHPGEQHPHHCAFVDAAFGTGHLRLDCREHEPAVPEAQAATWAQFASGAAIVQASN